jgi:WD40-like Beta Propeller Repeat
VNTAALEAVPSMDSRATFYFVSDRSYKQTASTIYRAYFADGELSGVELAPGVSTATPGIVNFDAEISADGETLYFVESQFSFFGRPKTARIMLARKRGNGFVRDPGGVLILRMVNTLELNYAPATSASELELFFTRLNQDGPAIYVARRVSRDAPFAPAQKIASITGFVEGPTISGDGRSLYYHKKENGKFVLYKVTRQEPWTPASENRKP